MNQEKEEKALRRRIRQGKVNRKDVAWRLAEMAFGKPNDCVRLVLEEAPDLNSLDLGLLSEVKRNEKGAVEVKLVDRLQILRQLADLTEEPEMDAQVFLQALRGEKDNA